MKTKLTLRSLILTGLCACTCAVLAQSTQTASSRSDASTTTAVVGKEALARELDAIFDAPEWRNARWGVMVTDVGTSEVLYGRESNKSFMPASNMKLYTTAAGIERLGPDFQYETQIYATGPVANGVLKGDLVVVGSGDPSISGRYNELIGKSGGFEQIEVESDDWSTTAILQQWVKAIKDAGIKRIEGAVVGDDDVFDDRHITSSWSLSYFAEWYAAENSGLTVNDNCWDVMISPGDKVGDPAQITSVLDTDYVKFINKITTVENRRSRRGETATGAEGTTATAAATESLSTATVTASEPRQDGSISIERDLEANEVTLSGTIAIDSLPIKEWGAVRNGTLFATTLLVGELERAGIKVASGPQDIDDLDREKADKLKTDRGTLLHTHESPPLFSLLAVINKPSQNFYADQLLKTLGAVENETGSYNAGEEVVKEWLDEEHVNPYSLQMYDGSGLSRMDQVEPQQTIGLLMAMVDSPYFEVFEASLPVMGVDGTLRSRMQNTPAHHNVKAKTGTIGKVRALSGYLTTNEGRRLAFSMMANNYMVPTSRATEAQDQALLKLISYQRESE